MDGVVGMEVVQLAAKNADLTQRLQRSEDTAKMLEGHIVKLKAEVIWPLGFETHRRGFAGGGSD